MLNLKNIFKIIIFVILIFIFSPNNLIYAIIPGFEEYHTIRSPDFDNNEYIEGGSFTGGSSVDRTESNINIINLNPFESVDPEISDNSPIIKVSNIVLVFYGILNYILGFVSLIMIIGFIYAGGLYIFNLGNEEISNKATKIMLYLFLGLIIIVLSFAIINFITAIYV